MTAALLALAGPVLAATAKKSSSGSASFLIVILVIGVAAYFFFLRPQRQKAQRQRQQGTQVEIGDDIVTVGGIVGRVVDLDGDHVTIVSGDDLTGAWSGGSEPVRLKLVRSAIGRKVDPASATDVSTTDVSTTDVTGADGTRWSGVNGNASPAGNGAEAFDEDDDDVADDGEGEELPKEGTGR